MNRLLRRQLQKCFGPDMPIPAEWRPFIDAVNLAYDQSDDDRHLLERSLDISSHELSQTNFQMRAIIDAFPDIFFRLDSQGTVLAHNGGSLDSLQLPDREIIGRPIHEVLLPQNGVDMGNAIERMGSENKALSVEYSTLIQGKLRTYESRLLPLPNKEIIVIVRDITVRTSAEAELRNIQLDLENLVAVRTAELQSTNVRLEREILERQKTNADLLQTEEKFRTLVEQLPAVTYLIDAAGLGPWIYVSPQINALLGYTPEEWIGTPELPAHCIHEEDRARVLEARQQCQAGATTFECEYRLISTEGTTVWCRDQAVLLQDDTTTEPFFQGVLLDITERVQLEEQLRQSLKMEAIGQLAGGIAHDFNNILTAIMGDCYLLTVMLGEDHPASEHVSRILTSADRAAGLTHQLLAYSRRQLLQPKVIDLSSIIVNLEVMLRRLIGENIWLFTTPGEEGCFIMADQGQIEQAIVNLVINSRDAIPSIGKISIETAVEVIPDHAPLSGSAPPEAKPGEYVVVTVSDTGTGIPPGVLSHIFDPFFTTKPQGKGTGLGLSTCYGIVKQSEGYITVESAPHHGATFRMFFPRVPREAAEPSGTEEQAPQVAGGGQSILVVEDETPVRFLIVKVLRQLGYEVHEAADGLEALQLAECDSLRNIDLLIADVIMPQMGGKELAQTLSLGRPEMKVLFLSGYTADTIDNGELLSSGAGFLQKPFVPTTLAHKVSEMLHPIPC